jgi:hypothetical protein
MGRIGWNLFHAIAHVADRAVRSFSHIVHDLGPVGMGLAASLGLPEAAGAGVFDLLMKAHAGNAAARQHVATVQARGGNWPEFLTRAASHLKAHPDFKAFSVHARVQAASARRSVTGVARPAPPTPYSNRPRSGARLGPSLPPQRQEPDDMSDSQDDTSLDGDAVDDDFARWYKPGGYGVDAGDS